MGYFRSFPIKFQLHFQCWQLSPWRKYVINCICDCASVYLCDACPFCEIKMASASNTKVDRDMTRVHVKTIC